MSACLRVCTAYIKGGASAHVFFLTVFMKYCFSTVIRQCLPSSLEKENEKGIPKSATFFVLFSVLTVVN